MSSNLKVNTILPSTGSNIGIGTNGGELNVDGGCKVQVGTALTLGHSIGLQYATQNLHSAGFEVNQINASGIITASSYRGDGSQLSGITGTTINNNADNRIITGSGTANTLNGEANLTFDGSTLNFTAASGDARLSLFGSEGNDARITLCADEGDDHIDQWNIRSKASNNTLTIDQFGGGTFNTRLTIASDANSGDVTVNTGDLIIGTAGKGVDFPNSSLFESSVNMHLDIASGNNDFYIRSGGTTFAAFKGANKDLQLTSGNLVIGTSGKGIDFSANAGSSATGSTTSSQLLDDYEEGTCTLTLESDANNTNTNGTGATDLAITGSYVKIGKMVTVTGLFSNLHVAGSSTDRRGHVFKRVRGLPFTAYNGTGQSAYTAALGYSRGVYGRYSTAVSPSNLVLYFFLNGGQSIAYTQGSRTDIVSTAYMALRNTTSDMYMQFQLTYPTT